jgi:NarL family two-component system response regulator LiaR
MDRNIIIVHADDMEIWRSIVKRVLERELNAKVTSVKNGKDAVATALELHPDLIILDQTMPVMTGEEAALEIKESWLEAKILMYTSFPEKIRYGLPATEKGHYEVLIKVVKDLLSPPS